MKRIYILTIVLLISMSSFAQRSSHKYIAPVNSGYENKISGGSSYAKTTGLGDTLKLSNIAAGDTLVIYTAGTDSGYLTGTNYWGDKAFAERYDFNSADSTMQVIGVFAQFSGNVNPASTKTISLNVWNVGSPQYITTGLFYSGFPATVFMSDIVPVTQVGVGATMDTMKLFLFDSATIQLGGPFFVGYNINYNFNSLAGDTIGLASSKDGHRTSAKTVTQVIVSDIDTVVNTWINVQNATQWSDGSWHDNYSDNDSLSNNLAIFPVVIIGHGTDVKGVTRNNLTFYGSYPNPAVNSTNIKFSLAKSTDVTIQVMDMNGRVLTVIKQTNLSTGQHTIPVNTSDMAAGNYLFLVRTADGDGIAGRMTISK